MESSYNDTLQLVRESSDQINPMIEQWHSPLAEFVIGKTSHQFAHAIDKDVIERHTWLNEAEKSQQAVVGQLELALTAIEVGNATLEEHHKDLLRPLRKSAIELARKQRIEVGAGVLIVNYLSSSQAIRNTYTSSVAGARQGARKKYRPSALRKIVSAQANAMEKLGDSKDDNSTYVRWCNISGEIIELEQNSRAIKISTRTKDPATKVVPAQTKEPAPEAKPSELKPSPELVQAQNELVEAYSSHLSNFEDSVPLLSGNDIKRMGAKKLRRVLLTEGQTLLGETVSPGLEKARAHETLTIMSWLNNMDPENVQSKVDQISETIATIETLSQEVRKTPDLQTTDELKAVRDRALIWAEQLPWLIDNIADLSTIHYRCSEADTILRNVQKRIEQISNKEEQAA